MISRVAAFRGERMAGFLTQREGFLIQMMEGRMRLPPISLAIEEAPGKHARVIFNPIYSNGQINSNGDTRKPKVDIDVEVRGVLIGYTGNRYLDDREQRAALAKDMEREFPKELSALIKKLQQKKWDPAGVEESFRQKYRGKWNRDTGISLYEKAEFRIRIRMEIVGTGTMG